METERMEPLNATFPLPGGRIIEIVQGDITQETVDAIVNAANSQLLHGAGVAGAIARRGGAAIQAESNAWVRQHGPVSHEEPAYTGAGSLPCRYVIHAVGPVLGEGDEDRKLADAIRGSLRLADRLGVQSIAFPAISTGIYGFPVERAARIFCETLRRTPARVRQMRLVLYDVATLETFLYVFQSQCGGAL